MLLLSEALLGFSMTMGTMTTTLAGIADLGRYPGYSESGLNVSGSVTISDLGDSLQLGGKLSGLEANVTGGLHIHIGTTCNDPSLVGGHFRITDSAGTLLPFPGNGYTSDANGDSMVNISLPGYNYSSVIGRAVVVHAQSGERIACGIIHTCPGYPSAVCNGRGTCMAGGDMTVAMCMCQGNFAGPDCMQCLPGWSGMECDVPITVGIAAMGRYPGYIGEHNATGDVNVAEVTVMHGEAMAKLLKIRASLSGLEASITGSIAIHAGYSCAEIGGPYYIGDTNHWANTTYMTDAAGKSDISVEAPMNLSSVAGRAVVLNSATGSPIACGTLSACPGSIQGNLCYGHGHCMSTVAGPSVCNCSGNWRAPDCMACVTGYYGPHCEEKCPGVPGANGTWDGCMTSKGQGTCNATTYMCECTIPFFGVDCSQTHIGIAAPMDTLGEQWLKFISGPVVNGSKFTLRLAGIRTVSPIPMVVKISQYRTNCWGTDMGAAVEATSNTVTLTAPAVPGMYSVCAKWRDDFELLVDDNGSPQNLTVIEPTPLKVLEGYENCEEYLVARNMTDSCGCFITTPAPSSTATNQLSPKVPNTFRVGGYSLTTQPTLYTGCCGPYTPKHPAQMDFGNGTSQDLFWGSCKVEGVSLGAFL